MVDSINSRPTITLPAQPPAITPPAVRAWEKKRRDSLLGSHEAFPRLNLSTDLESFIGWVSWNDNLRIGRELHFSVGIQYEIECKEDGEHVQPLAHIQTIRLEPILARQLSKTEAILEQCYTTPPSRSKKILTYCELISHRPGNILVGWLCEREIVYKTPYFRQWLRDIAHEYPEVEDQLRSMGVHDYLTWMLPPPPPPPTIAAGAEMVLVPDVKIPVWEERLILLGEEVKPRPATKKSSKYKFTKTERTELLCLWGAAEEDGWSLPAFLDKVRKYTGEDVQYDTMRNWRR
jgi:hypothetical protein